MAYKGRDVNELIQKFGVPDKEFKAPNGDLMYTWTQTSTSHVPAYTPPSVTTYNRNGNLVAAITTPGLTTGGYSYSTSCRVDATADKRTHVITALRYVGPGCVARPDQIRKVIGEPYHTYPVTLKASQSEPTGARGTP